MNGVISTDGHWLAYESDESGRSEIYVRPFPNVETKRIQVSTGGGTRPLYNATLRTTCVATQLEGGHALNALPQLAAANVNCRVLPEDSAEYVLVTPKKVVADEQVTITPILQMASGPASPMRPDVLAAVRSTTQKIWPGVETIPIMVMGATDGRYLRAVGIPTYGIQGFFFDKTTSGFTGGMNAWRWSLFYEGQTFLYDLVKTLSGAAN
jgi:acetylornithine deacetylase/succinyl-diaminopimelate desuccinylase-like protein